jgi:deazaflavin-dependent oxidoreductase (nitroreductase family)
VYKRSNGRFTATSALTGLPIVILTTTGARSGKARAIPVQVTPYGGDIILVGSNYGSKRHPGWYHNLKANPTCWIASDGRSQACVAREAEGEEKDTCWQLATKIMPTFDICQSRTAGREIPVMILSPEGKV